MQRILPGSAEHELRRPERGLEEYVRRIIADCRRQTAHDPGQADRSRVIGDHECVRVDFDLPLIEQPDFLAGLREPRPDRTFHKLEVIGMQRLSELQHDVIRDIDNRVDGPEAAAAQPFGHPYRGLRTGVDAPDDPARETGTALRQYELNRVFIINGALHRLQRGPI